jgi:hypothetical protein
VTLSKHSEIEEIEEIELGLRPSFLPAYWASGEEKHVGNIHYRKLGATGP